MASSGMVTDTSLIMAQSALKGLEMRRDVIGQNIANVDTPGFKAQEVDFESTLKRAINLGDSLPLTTTNERHETGLKSETGDIYLSNPRQGNSSRADGNNVDISQELEQMTETKISYDALITTVTRKLSLLKTIATR